MTHQANVPDTITVTERHIAEVRSTGADVSITVSERQGAGAGGRIAELRRALLEQGFSEGDVMLEGLRKESWAWIPIPFAVVAAGVALFAGRVRTTALVVAGGLVVLFLLLRAARAGTTAADLKIRCADAARVQKVLDTILAFTATEIRHIHWRYEIDPESRDAWVAGCIERANRRAAHIASALGVKILGVHAFFERHTTPHTTAPSGYEGDEAPRARRSMAKTSIADSLGSNLSATEAASVEVTIQYRIGGAEPAEAAAPAAAEAAPAAEDAP